MSDEHRSEHDDRPGQYSLRAIIKFIFVFSIPLIVIANLPTRMRQFVIEGLTDAEVLGFILALLLLFMLPLLPVLLRPDLGDRPRRRWYQRRRWYEHQNGDNDTDL